MMQLVKPPAPVPTMAPHAYLLRITQQMCRSCGHRTSISEIYTQTRLKAHFGMGKDGLHTQICDKPLYNLPVEKQYIQHHTPFCHRCEGTAWLANLPSPPAPSQTKPTPQTPTRPGILVAKRPLAEELARKSRKSGPKTLDDIMKL